MCDHPKKILGLRNYQKPTKYPGITFHTQDCLKMCHHSSRAKQTHHIFLQKPVKMRYLTVLISFRMMIKEMMMCTSQAWAGQRFVPSGLSSHGAWHTSFSSESSSGSLFLSVSDTTWSTSKTSKLKPAFSAH